MDSAGNPTPTFIDSARLLSERQSAEFAFENESLGACLMSDKGGREENQDHFGYAKAKDGSLVFSLADGLGGHAGGAVASRTAIEGLNRFLTEENGNRTFNFYRRSSFSLCFERALQAIRLKQEEEPSLHNMRTTLTVLAINDGLAYWGHLGDARLYRFRDEGYFRTKDNSVPQMLCDLGQIEEREIRTHPARNRLLKALGNRTQSRRLLWPKTTCNCNRAIFSNYRATVSGNGSTNGKCSPATVVSSPSKRRPGRCSIPSKKSRFARKGVRQFDLDQLENPQSRRPS